MSVSLAELKQKANTPLDPNAASLPVGKLRLRIVFRKSMLTILWESYYNIGIKVSVTVREKSLE